MTIDDSREGAPMSEEEVIETLKTMVFGAQAFERFNPKEREALDKAWNMISVASAKQEPRKGDVETLTNYFLGLVEVLRLHGIIHYSDMDLITGTNGTLEHNPKKSESEEPNEIEVFTDCRKQFEDAVKKVFGAAGNFFDFIESGEYSELYDVFYNYDDECYIINRETGEYINWYKYTHIGRDIHSTVHPNDFVEFLTEFKGDTNAKGTQETT